MCSRAVCVHKPFSTSPEWLPPTPSYRLSQEQLDAMTSSNIEIQEFELFGGIQTVVIQGINDGGKELSQVEMLDPSNKDVVSRINCFHKMLNFLQDVSINAIGESVQQMEVQCNTGYQASFDHRSITRSDKDVDSPEEPTAHAPDADKFTSLKPADIGDSVYDNESRRYKMDQATKVAIQKEMLSRSTLKEGYVFWLDWSKVGPSWNETKPKVFNYFQEVMLLLY